MSRVAVIVGAAVARAREDVGKSKRELARNLGVDPSYVGLMESGKRLPSVEMLYRLARCLGVNPSALVPSELAR